MPTYESVIYNGLWEYRPDFSNETWRQGALGVENITSGPDGLAAGQGRKGTMIWTMHSPYVLVGGRLEVDGTDAAFSLSADGKAWRKVNDSLDKCFSIVGPALYDDAQLKCELNGSARLRRLAIINDLQMAPMALPEMVVGKTLSSIPINPPATARCALHMSGWSGPRLNRRRPRRPRSTRPRMGKRTVPDIVFQWTAAHDPDGDAIGDYHFELSSRADMRWPLSMCFYKLISRTADVIKDKGKSGGKEKITVKAQYTLSQPGLLTPDRRYYWRVRAMDEKACGGLGARPGVSLPRPGVSPERHPRLRPRQRHGPSPLDSQSHRSSAGQLPGLWQ